jgi:hypothetical protein
MTQPTLDDIRRTWTVRPRFSTRREVIDLIAAAQRHPMPSGRPPEGASEPRPIVDREIRGLVKLVADRHTDRLLGAHLLANAGEVIQAAVYGLTAGFTTAQLADTWMRTRLWPKGSSSPPKPSGATSPSRPAAPPNTAASRKEGTT